MSEPIQPTGVCQHSLGPQQCAICLWGEIHRLRAQLADLDNPGNLSLILDCKKLCCSECKTWCERCMDYTARRLVKACLGLRAKIESAEKVPQVCDYSGPTTTRGRTP